MSVDDQVRGTTPVTVAGFTEGAHSINFSLSKHYDIKGVVNVLKDQTVPVFCLMYPTLSYTAQGHEYGGTWWNRRVFTNPVDSLLETIGINTATPVSETLRTEVWFNGSFQDGSTGVFAPQDSVLLWPYRYWSRTGPKLSIGTYEFQMSWKVPGTSQWYLVASDTFQVNAK